MHSVLEISPVSRLSPVIAPVGHTLIQALHFTHFPVSILKPRSFLKPRNPRTAPTGQKYLHQALLSLNSSATGTAASASSVNLSEPKVPAAAGFSQMPISLIIRCGHASAHRPAPNAYQLEDTLLHGPQVVYGCLPPRVQGRVNPLLYLLPTRICPGKRQTPYGKSS